MEFRPCIDIHNGKVKQIVGSSLKDEGDFAKENFVSTQDAPFYARMYQKDHISGGHIILLNAKDSEYYEKTKAQALAALAAYPGGLMVGGGITDENAKEFIEAGASHVIVTSFVFSNGQVNYEHLQRLKDTVGREHLVIDVSCRKRGADYYVVTDRWQKFTDEKVNVELLDKLMDYGDEFLVHAVDVEGKNSGIEEELAALLGSWGKIPVTYAGGVRSFSDLQLLKQLGQGRLNVTIGSALDLFGGQLSYKEVLRYLEEE